YGFSELLVVSLEIARHSPKVPMRGLGFRRDEVNHDGSRLMFGRSIEPALSCMSHTDVDKHMAGRSEPRNLPAIHRHISREIVELERLLPERRRDDVFHEAAGNDSVAFHPRMYGRLVDLVLTDAVGMDIRFVRKVHEVVDHEPIIAIDVIQAAAIRPLVAYCPVQVGNKAGVGQSRVARPDPDKAIPLLDRITFYAGKTANPLHGHGYGLAIATHDQSVIAANQIPIFYVAQRQRRATVRAEVF